MISKYKKYRSIKDRDIRDHPEGIFHIDSEKIKNDLTKFVNLCLKTFKEYLHMYYSTKSNKLFKTLQDFNTKLNRDPSDIMKLPDYCEFIATYDQAKEQKNFLLSEKEYVAKALKLLQ